MRYITKNKYLCMNFYEFYELKKICIAVSLKNKCAHDINNDSILTTFLFFKTGVSVYILHLCGNKG